jgi:menaquinone-specific isochorismate synthase
MRLVTSPLKDHIDLNDFAGDDGMLFVRDGVGIAGRGTLVTGTAKEIEATLRATECDNHVGGPGTGAVAFGAIPFLSDREPTFIVPEVLIGKREDGTAFITRLEDDTSQLLAAEIAQTVSNKYSLQSGHVSPDDYKRIVSLATDAIKRDEFQKVVLARDLFIDADQPMSVGLILKRLKASYGSSYRYSFDGLVGASPELLVEVLDGVVRSHPLAGTAPRTGNAQEDDRLADQLLRSDKNQAEHKIVIDMVRETLLPYCSYLDWEPEPSIVQVANVQHLGSAAEGVLTRPHTSVLQLARELCPTPALGGSPREAAIKWIGQYEGIDRGRYGGAIGWLDAHGNGTWAVTIRCAEFDESRRRAHLFAGCGIVADSDPDSELSETQTKFKAMISAITGSTGVDSLQS